MSTASRFQRVSVRDYLDGEGETRGKNEYVDGVVYAMVGGTVAHSRIASNATGMLHAQLRGERCQVFNSVRGKGAGAKMANWASPSGQAASGCK